MMAPIKDIFLPNLSPIVPQIIEPQNKPAM